MEVEWEHKWFSLGIIGLLDDNQPNPDTPGLSSIITCNKGYVQNSNTNMLFLFHAVESEAKCFVSIYNIDKA